MPCATLAARPVALTVAVATADEFQVTDELRSLVLASVNVPVAVSWRLLPNATVAFAGVMASDASAGGPTVTASAPLIAPEAARILAVPCDAADARPALLTDAIAGFDELHSAVPVRSCVLLSV